MEFWVVFVQTLIKAVIMAGVAFGGIRLGKYLRDRKSADAAGQAEKEES
ncbi:hypothetical protein [Murimonas intestini]|uniref:Vanadium nitrogenase n=1 Tax=Murimonas intestini TaxID=1337051 RepID=A0AB73T4Y4_9FIRM|nr:hypothetical protein [Murimonas intestini]MCR1840617.1 hypothetical protein [Murimonas intestini]MCR1865330.1 hypothetical protein [Murimonas intestini]MCR1882959.1 hypothetical protein [Murimonas intestini]